MANNNGEQMHEVMKKTIGNEIHVLSNLIHRTLDNSPAKRQIERVTGTNTWIIGYIACREGQDVFQKDLEKQFGITRSTASKVVNLMEQKGLVERKSVPGDARLKKLVLTERSWEIFHQMTEEFKSIEAALCAGFSEEELEQFFDYIHRMQNNMKMREEKSL